MNTMTRIDTTLRHGSRLALPRSGHGQIDHLIDDALQLSPNVIGYHVSRRLAELYPDRALIEVMAGQFDLEEYARAGHCLISARTVPFGEMRTHWLGADEGVETNAINAWFDVRWQGEAFEVLTLHWGGEHPCPFFFILARSCAAAENFYAAVCAWNAEIRAEVLVFNGHCWSKDEELFKDIKSATFDNLVLSGTLKREIYDDLAHFFGARGTYEAYGVPWKRGILFLGPPGNGKTHAVKAVLNALGKPCLYVKSLHCEDAIRAAFAQARRSAPCILVLEDLDALVKEAHRSVLLNELDGFSANTGVVTLATTNHPERLDPALIERPSRFDRKYHFGLPAVEERRMYIMQWNNSLQPALRVSGAAIERLADGTEGFSYAYLKELFVSATMRWMVIAMEGAMELVLDEQLELLRSQMASTKAGIQSSKAHQRR